MFEWQVVLFCVMADLWAGGWRWQDGEMVEAGYKCLIL